MLVNIEHFAGRWMCRKWAVIVFGDADDILVCRLATLRLLGGAVVIE